MADDLSPETLFEVPPSEFVAARNRLAAALRAAKRPAEATAIKALTKPAASVWATNRVARHAPQAVARFLRTADELRKAQTGGGTDARAALREAAAAHRQQLDALVDEARRLLQEAGQRAAPAVLERVAANFRDGALSPEARPVLVAGRLARDVEPLDIGALLSGMPLRPAPKAPPPPAPATREKPAGKPPAHHHDELAARRAREAREEAARLRKALATAEREAEAAERKATRAEDERQQAEKRVREAQATLARAEQARDRAAADAARARAEADEKERERARVADALDRLQA